MQLVTNLDTTPETEQVTSSRVTPEGMCKIKQNPMRKTLVLDTVGTEQVGETVNLLMNTGNGGPETTQAMENLKLLK